MFIYMLANAANTVVYIGVTNDLVRRVYEHRTHADPGSFTAKYDVTRLVYYEECADAYRAIEREKQLKGKSRKAKNKMITAFNPEWADLYESIQ